MKHLENDIWLWMSVRMQRFLDKILYGLKKETGAIYQDIEKCVLFIGYPRSGHSFVGSVLDAHPEVFIAHRLDAILALKQKFDFSRLAYLVQRNSERFAANSRQLTGYKYPLATGWQGTVRRLRVFGDQEGKNTNLRLADDPGLLDRLCHQNKPEIHFIHVIRNPFDNISTWSLRAHRSLSTTIERYFQLCECSQKIINHCGKARVHTIRHEDVIFNFNETISILLQSLNLTLPKHYLKVCEDAVFKTPHISRNRVVWNDDLIYRVKINSERFDFLSSYL